VERAAKPQGLTRGWNEKAAAGAKTRGGFAFGGQLQKQTTAVSGGRF
jgi:hypothetical protein